MVTVKENKLGICLALTVLFGEEFLEMADEGLLASLQQDPARWGKLLMEMWSIMKPSTPQPVLQSSIATSISVAPSRSQTNGHLQRNTTVSVKSVHQREAIVAPLPAADTQVEQVTPLQFFDPRLETSEQSWQPISATPQEVKSLLIDLLIEKTGYPAEALEDTLDLELDLGIDSVKQLEVLSKVRERYQLTLDEDFRMRDYSTIQAITDYIVSVLQQQKKVANELTAAV